MIKEIKDKTGKKRTFDLRIASTRKLRRQALKNQLGSNRIRKAWWAMMERKAQAAGMRRLASGKAVWA